MKVAIIGFGIEGQSAAHYWLKQGNEVTICDQNASLRVPAELKAQLGPDYLNNLDKFDLIVRQQSIHPDKIKTTRPVTSIIDEFMEHCPAPIIGVTGTKGKGTTSTLIAKILEAAGHRAWLGGNIGTSPLDFLDKVDPTNYVVLELSSSQLIDLKHSPQVALCLAITPDHLDYHTDLDEYTVAKANIFRYQKPSDLAVYYKPSPQATEIAQLSPGKKRAYPDTAGAIIKEDWLQFGDTRIVQTKEVGLIGPHNLDNIMAAVAATWDIVQSPEPMARAVKDFTGLEHRLELVGEVDGVKFYDDSFSTTPETSMAAIKSFTEPKVLILGGSEKGVTYDGLAKAVANANIASVIAIGLTGPAITDALARAGFNQVVAGEGTMAGIVRQAREHAPSGGVVLLSPACASFDMFKNYKDRGEQFKAAVNNLH